MNQEIERIMALSNAFGPSGFEEEVADLVEKNLNDLYETHRDHMCNVTVDAQREEGKPVIMLDAHMDEVGAIVQAIKPNGTMNFLPIGGWQKTSFPSSSFILRGRNGEKHPAVVAVKPPHFTSAKEKDSVMEVSDMVLDAGTCSMEETKELGISIATPACPDITCRYDEKRQVFYGKAFDCRIGVAAEIETMRRLHDEHLPSVMTASFSTQEEVGERGVLANVNRLKPDVVICFEGCPADDTFSPDYMIQAAMHKGPMLRHMDVSMITNPRFQRFALDIAEKYGIPVQESVRSGGGTNGAIINSHYGIPSIIIGIPVRYIHSSNCWTALDDYENAVRLACAIAKELTCDILETL